MQQRSADRDFAAYNEAQEGRPVRPLAMRAAQLVLEERGRSLRTTPDDRLVAVELVEPSRRPVGLGRIAAARAVEARDVLERDEDVTVELDVRDVLDRAVGGQGPLLVFAAEQRELDLLALVLVRVVLHGRSVADPAWPSRYPRRVAAGMAQSSE